MEAKKNPHQDVHRMSFRFFLIGLAISVCMALVAFEWTTEKKPPIACSFDTSPENSWTVLPNHYVIEPVTRTQKKIQTPPILIIPTTTPEDAHDDIPILDFTDQIPPALIDDINFSLPLEEDPTTIHTTAEVPPVPVGGFESFYSHISKNLKYPHKAVRNGVDGKVFIEFVVDRHGHITQMKIVKGIGAGCDEEAMRVMALTNWEPGRQRGKPVNVRMVIPIFFKINK